MPIHGPISGLSGGGGGTGGSPSGSGGVHQISRTATVVGNVFVGRTTVVLNEVVESDLGKFIAVARSGSGNQFPAWAKIDAVDTDTNTITVSTVYALPTGSGTGVPTQSTGWPSMGVRSPRGAVIAPLIGMGTTLELPVSRPGFTLDMLLTQVGTTGSSGLVSAFGSARVVANQAIVAEEGGEVFSRYIANYSTGGVYFEIDQSTPFTIGDAGRSSNSSFGYALQYDESSHELSFFTYGTSPLLQRVPIMQAFSLRF